MKDPIIGLPVSFETQAFASDDKARQIQIASTALGLATVAIGFATLVRPMVSTHDFSLTVIGVFNTVLCAALWWFITCGHLQRHAAVISLLVINLLPLPLILITGGIDSQFCTVVPLFPVFAAVMGSRRLSTFVLAFWLVIIPVLVLMGPYLPEITETWNDNKSASRGFWLALSSIIGFAFGTIFNQRLSKLHQQLQTLADKDALTGLANRRVLESTLEREFAIARRSNQWLTVMMIDIDHFKQFNDVLGHSEGDRILQQVSKTLQGVTRFGQDTVARYGGEEFVLVLSNTSPTTARQIAEKVRLSISDLGIPHGDGTGRHLTVTVGLASGLPTREANWPALLKQADEALYKGKQAGRDQVVEAQNPIVPTLSPVLDLQPHN